MTGKRYLGTEYSLGLRCNHGNCRRRMRNDKRMCSICSTSPGSVEVITMHSTSWLIDEINIMRLFGDLKNAAITISRIDPRSRPCPEGLETQADSLAGTPETI